MREPLKEYFDKRGTFTGVFERFGEKRGWKGKTEKTVLLRDVRDSSGNIVSDHLWLNCTQGLEWLCLSPGDRVEFDARAKTYQRGYFGGRSDVYAPASTDIKLSNPTNCRVI